MYSCHQILSICSRKTNQPTKLRSRLEIIFDLAYQRDITLHRPTKKFFVKRKRMLNRFEVKSRAISLKMHLVLPNWLQFWRYFYLYFFIILLGYGAFSSMRSFFYTIFLVSHLKFSVHTTCMYIDSYKNKL